MFKALQYGDSLKSHEIFQGNSKKNPDNIAVHIKTVLYAVQKQTGNVQRSHVNTRSNAFKLC